jgi:hypothetical protein
MFDNIHTTLACLLYGFMLQREQYLTQQKHSHSSRITGLVLHVLAYTRRTNYALLCLALHWTDKG